MTRCRLKDCATKARYEQVLKETMAQLGMTEVPKLVKGQRIARIKQKHYGHVCCTKCSCITWEPIRKNPELCLCAHYKNEHQFNLATQPNIK